MTRGRWLRPGWLGAGLAALLASAVPLGSAHGQQSTAGMGTTNGAPPGLRTNAFANPVMNPFMNPWATTRTVPRDELFLYWMAARQTRQAQEKQARQAPAEAAPADRPFRQMRPGGSAGSYFGRPTVDHTAVKSYYTRSNPYFRQKPQ